ncbi:MAG: hypothetical protein P4L50_00105 [Anaerolineaceae bacterium]|nr:hypothetical protein [Anaerolineaceae bacterium]
MKMFAVSYINWCDHELTTEFIHADTWEEALKHHSAVHNDTDWLNDLPKDKEEAKQYFFDCDSMFESVEVPAN